MNACLLFYIVYYQKIVMKCRTILLVKIICKYIDQIVISLRKIPD